MPRPLEGIPLGQEQGGLGHIDGGCRGRGGRRLGHLGCGDQSLPWRWTWREGMKGSVGLEAGT